MCNLSHNLYILEWGLKAIKCRYSLYEIEEVDPKTEAQLLKWYEEVSDDDVVFSDPSDLDDALSEHSIHVTDTDQSGEDKIIDAVSTTAPEQGFPQWSGKDGTIWLKHKPNIASTKVRGANVLRSRLPSVKSRAKNMMEIIDCWKLFFPDELIEKIVSCTNQKLDNIRSSYQQLRDCLPTDLEEMSAFIGLLYMAGIKKGHHLNTKELWAKYGTAPDYFVATISRRRFHLLLQAIRFDDMNLRAENSLKDL
ncbi:hypothetical protein NQ318_018589 [Aromia moschata]|uniref:PiggyBac transposable element-derived protein domain-containing protein n=1 Tax=Aromia moschata TaxID=1265417 RepID=A0AAV8ZIG8_9CUCU|nr:hypothetical protein NQ318_018589 [Aromia moschata]